MNAAINHHFLCDDHGQVTAVLQPPFDELHDAAMMYLLRRAPDQGGNTTRIQKPHRGYAEVRQSDQTPNRPWPAFSVSSWNKRVMVGATGIEPVTARV